MCSDFPFFNLFIETSGNIIRLFKLNANLYFRVVFDSEIKRCLSRFIYIVIDSLIIKLINLLCFVMCFQKCISKFTIHFKLEKQHYV